MTWTIISQETRVVNRNGSVLYPRLPAKNQKSSLSRGGEARPFDGAPERTRTPDTRFRKPLLYPAELRARMLRTRCRVSIFYTIPPFDVHVNCWQEIRVRTPLLQDRKSTRLNSSHVKIS